MSLNIEAPAGGWGSTIGGMSEDRLLLTEAAHRTANEISAAIAALRLIKPAGGSRVRWQLLGGAVERLEGFAATNRVLALPTATPINLSLELERLCEGLGAARVGVRGSKISLDVGDYVVDGAVARRVLLVAAELIHNGIRHVLEKRRGMLAVVMRVDARDVMLGVVDDGRGIQVSADTRGNGIGSVIVSELVRRAGGVMSCESGPQGTTFHVAIPHTAALPAPTGES